MTLEAISLIAAGFVAAVPVQSGELGPPFQVAAGGQPLDVQRSGMAAPFFGDFDGDGLDDLLVGEFRDGLLRVYRNLGSIGRPQFKDYVWFKAGGELGRVPTG